VIRNPIARARTASAAWARRNPVWRSYRVATLLLRTLYVINRERSRVVKAHARGDMDVRPNIEALVRVLHDFRLTAVALGGLLIKLGQFLGARADLLPQEALDELASLHDEVPAERFEDIVTVLEGEWRRPWREVCASIDPVTAGAASLGQVHQARLLDGRTVALKVQRPGIDAIVRTDLRTLRFVLRVVAILIPAADRVTDLRGLYREFSRTVAEELDYIQEGKNAERFADMFADDPGIRVPDVLEEHSARRVLVLEWMDGIKVNDIAALDAAHINRDRLATRLAQAYFAQVLEVGYFHADPHPGNILIQPDPAGDKLVFLDFGMMGTVTPRMRKGLRDCFTAAVTQDAAVFVRGLDALGFLSDFADRQAVERLVGALLVRFSSMTTGGRARMRGGRQERGRPAGFSQEHYHRARINRRRDELDPREVLGDVETSLYDQPFRLPAQLAFFGRMVGMLLGLTATLSPSFDFVAVATPYARQYIGTGGVEGILNLLGVESWDALGRDLLRDGLATVRSLASVPRRLDQVLQRAEQGELHLVVESAARRNVRAARRARRNRGRGGNPLTRPVPVWLPVSVVGAAAFAFLALRGPARRAAKDAYARTAR